MSESADAYVDMLRAATAPGLVGEGELEQLLSSVVLVGEVSLRVEGIPVVGPLTFIDDREIRVPIGHLLVAPRRALGKHGEPAKVNLEGVTGLLGGIQALIELIRQLRGQRGGQAAGGGDVQPPQPPAVEPPPPTEDIVYPAEVRVLQWRPTTPEHVAIGYTVEERGGETWLVPTTTDSFNDGTFFTPEIAYLNEKGAGIRFDGPFDTPATHHLHLSSMVTVRTADGAREGAIVGGGPDSRLLVNGGGVIADGGQIVKEYERTLGMDPRIKLIPVGKGGLAGGQEVVIEVFGPRPGGRRVAATPVHFTVR